MKNIFLLLSFVTFLCADHPRIYSALGDEIYTNVSKIEKLADIRELYEYKGQIDTYVSQVERAKAYGFLIEKGDPSADKEIYLEDLRQLIGSNNFFKRLVQTFYNSAIKNQNNTLFYHLINSGLLDLEKHQDEILAYYHAHVGSVPTEGLIDMLLEREKLKEEELRRLANQKKPKPDYVIEKENEQAKIERLRQADLERRESIRKTLEEEEMKKKAAIIQKQKEELAK